MKIHENTGKSRTIQENTDDDDDADDDDDDDDTRMIR